MALIEVTLQRVTLKTISLKSWNIIAQKLKLSLPSAASFNLKTKNKLAEGNFILKAKYRLTAVNKNLEKNILTKGNFNLKTKNKLAAGIFT